MTQLTQYLPIAQIIVAAILIILILIQQRGTALGSAFGGASAGGSFYAARRGIQKKMLWLTIIFAVIFLALAAANLFL